MPSTNKTPNYGLNQWQGNEYPKRQDFVDDNAALDTAIKARADEIANHAANQTVHVTTLSCTKSSTVYALTGLTATSGKVPVMFSADAAYTTGDTVTIDGTAYALATRDGSTLGPGAWAAGAIVQGIADVDAKTLTVGPPVPHSALDIMALPIYDHATQTDANATFGIGIHKCNTWLNYPSGSPDAQGDLLVLPYNPFPDGSSAGWLWQIFFSPESMVIFKRLVAGGSFGAWTNLADGGTAADTTSINSALTLSTAEPTGTLAPGTLWGVYDA